MKVAYIPKMVHGLQSVVPVTEKVHTPIITNRSTANFRSFRMRSAFSGTLIFLGICLPPSHTKSCIAPKEQINPQKNRPQIAVMIKAAATNTIRPAYSVHVKEPVIIAE